MRTPARFLRRGSISGRTLLQGLVLPAALAVWWQVSTAGAGRTGLLPPPGRVLDILVDPGADLLATGSLFWNTGVSLARVALGFGLAVLIGVPVGVLMGYSGRARSLLNLSMEMARPLSPIALVPLSLILFRSMTFVELLGLTHLRYQHHLLHEMQVGMVFILFWGGFFPIL
ncbi:hypothetical protein JW921_06450, partial [Candidatus Fermentibacterales bacterium]|nr:hypothetical protein [Candidatus Fermentibacterales bacterium]